MSGVVHTPSPNLETVDDRIIAMMRLVLAASALVIITIDPSEPSQHVALTYFTLTLYTIYSALLYVFALKRSSWLAFAYRWAHWADVAWYTVLISLSNGTNSIFFFGFFFAILVAAFRWGFRSGLRVALVSVLLFGSVALTTVAQGDPIELNRLLVRPVYLLVIGYLMAYWGGFERTLKRRLALLKEITTLSNPRFGIDRTMGTLLERLRAFYDVDQCLLLTAGPQTGEHRMRRATRNDSERAVTADPLPPEVAAQLLAVPQEAVVIHNGSLQPWNLFMRSYAYDARTGSPITDGLQAGQTIAAMMEAPVVVSVPFYDRHEVAGRMYLPAHARHFDPSDADFLLHAIEHIAPIIDNVRLVDRLATSAAEEERQRIARDLHDSVIQPYIGLQIGLAAVRQKIEAGHTNVQPDIERLLSLTNDGIRDVRGYVHGLRTPAENDSSLVPAIRRFGAKFAEATGIDVQVEATADMRGNDRLAAEVFQMVAEGLSNIRRHTHARSALISLGRNNRTLTLRIENDVPHGEEQSFTPRSISERAAALGGHARVDQPPGQPTAVLVEIPL